MKSKNRKIQYLESELVRKEVRIRSLLLKNREVLLNLKSTKERVATLLADKR